MGKEKSRQRRDINSTLGFERYGLIDEQNSIYAAPDSYPEDAQRYLNGLARCGTLSGACRLAGIGVHNIYRFRKELEGFYTEEDIAKDCLTDVLEESLYACGLGAEKGMARVKALQTALQSNRPEKYDRAQKHDINGEVQVSWLDLLKQQENQED